MPVLFLVSAAAAVLVAGFLETAEAALLGFPRVRRRQLEEEGDKRSKWLERALDHPQGFVLAVLVVKSALYATAFGLAAFAGLDLASRFGWPAGAGVAATIAGVATAAVVFGEILPKAIGTEWHEPIAFRLSRFVWGLSALVRPVTYPLEKLATGAYRAAGTNAEDGAAHFKSEEELKTLITLGTEEGILEEDEEEMIHSVIEFGETTAKEIMVPRIDMNAVPGDATLDHVKAYVLDSGYSRLPVYQGSVDNVVGVLYAKDMLVKLVGGNGSMQVKELARDPFYVPETKKLDDLLAEMREKRVHMAIVLDEYGGTAGLITLEDILEEIVGEIFDEYDLRTDPIRRLDEHTAVVDARTLVADVNRELDLDIPEDGPYDTVGGFVFHKLGRLGKEGEIVHGDGFDMSVEKVSNRRILRVRIVRREVIETAPEALVDDEDEERVARADRGA